MTTEKYLHELETKLRHMELRKSLENDPKKKVQLQKKVDSLKYGLEELRKRWTAEIEYAVLGTINDKEGDQEDDD